MWKRQEVLQLLQWMKSVETVSKEIMAHGDCPLEHGDSPLEMGHSPEHMGTLDVDCP